MTEIPDFLKKLISAPGLSGHELPARKLVEETWGPLVDELTVSRLGSLHGLRCGKGAPPRPSILIATHMDAIGLMVTGIEEGFLRVTSIGGLDPRVLPGQLVTVHGRQDLPALIVPPMARLLPNNVNEGAAPIEYLLIDTGLLPEEVAQLVRLGDLVSFAQAPLDMAGETLSGHSLDNRASVAALTACLDQLQTRPHDWDVWAVATVQEEVGVKGAYTSTFQLRPALAVAVDVTFGSGPGSPSHKTFPLGKGPTLLWGPDAHPALHAKFKELAERLEIPFAVEVAPRHSGTDGFATQVTAEGIPSMVVSIPLRYMHTPVEMVAIKDITRTGRLLAEFIAQLDMDFISRLKWDD
jgi:putative aminopeptidase FrvX